MKEKVLLGIAGLAMSFSVLAGGGGTSWQPSVGPADCLKTVPSPQVQLLWNDIDACNDVVKKGYAYGVYVSGFFIYEGGQAAIQFTGAANPSKGEKLNYPETLNGNKYKGTTGVKYQWIK